MLFLFSPALLCAAPSHPPTPLRTSASKLLINCQSLLRRSRMFALQQHWAELRANWSFILNIWEVVPTHPASQHKYSFCCRREWGGAKVSHLFFFFLSFHLLLDPSRPSRLQWQCWLSSHPKCFHSILLPLFSRFSLHALLPLPALLSHLSRFFSFSLLTPHHCLFFSLPLFARTHLVLELTLTPLSLCFFMCSQLGTPTPPPLQTLLGVLSYSNRLLCWGLRVSVCESSCSEATLLWVFFPEPRARQRRTLFFCAFFSLLEQKKSKKLNVVVEQLNSYHRTIEFIDLVRLLLSQFVKIYIFTSQVAIFLHNMCVSKVPPWLCLACSAGTIYAWAFVMSLRALSITPSARSLFLPLRSPWIWSLFQRCGRSNPSTSFSHEAKTQQFQLEAASRGLKWVRSVERLWANSWKMPVLCDL